MAHFIKKLLYKNIHIQIKKRLKIPRGILDDEQIKYEFDIKNSISRLAE